MLRIVVLPLFIVLFSMACMGQTFQYSRGWTNGKRAGATTTTTLNNLLHKEDDSLAELFEVQDANEKRLERCLLNIQRLIRNPLFIHTSAGTAFATNSAIPNSPISNANGNSNNNNNNNNNLNNNPYGRNHQSNELFEELGAGGGAIIDANDYVKD